MNESDDGGDDRLNTRAIVIPKAHTVELQEVALKPLGVDDVLVQTALTSISAGTERMLLSGVMPHPMLQFPVVPGYETVGEVIETGDNAKAWLGKRVYVGGNYGFIGVNPAFGGQSQYIVAPQTHLTDLQTLSDEQGVLLALAATALHGVDQLGTMDDGRWTTGDGGRKTEDGASVMILGQGIVGQLAARIAKARGMHVTVTDKVPARLALSIADEVIDISDSSAVVGGPSSVVNLPSPISNLIDATGKMEAIAPLLMKMQKGGRIVLLGFYDCLSLPYQPIFLKELTLVSSSQWAPGDVARARDMLVNGEIDTANLITHRAEVSDAPHAFDVSFNDPACVKMVLNWRKS